MDVRYINPFVDATQSLFEKMLGTQLTRGQICLLQARNLYDGISGFVHIRGAVRGTVVLHCCRNLAIQATRILWQEAQSQVDERVRDTVGELTNIVVGQVRSRPDFANVNMSLPVIKHERFHASPFPPNSQPIRIPFESPFGPLAVDVWFLATEAEKKRQLVAQRVAEANRLREIQTSPR